MMKDLVIKDTTLILKTCSIMISIVNNTKKNTLSSALVHLKPNRLDLETTDRCITKN
jgi:hypothetical protein